MGRVSNNLRTKTFNMKAVVVLALVCLAAAAKLNNLRPCQQNILDNTWNIVAGVTRTSLLAAFDVVDVDADGFLDEAEMRYVLCRVGVSDASQNQFITWLKGEGLIPLDRLTAGVLWDTFLSPTTVMYYADVTRSLTLAFDWLNDGGCT